MKGIVSSIALAGCFGFASVAAMGQQVVHALTGTVRSINSVTKTISVFQDNGTEGSFSDATNVKARLNIDKKIVLDNTAADAFKKAGAYVVVLYYGHDDERIAVALKNLGEGPFTSAVGTVLKFEGKRSISIQDESGVSETYRITQDTIGEGYLGAVDGYKIQVQKGDKVRVVASKAGGDLTAMFVRLM